MRGSGTLNRLQGDGTRGSIGSASAIEYVDPNSADVFSQCSVRGAVRIGRTAENTLSVPDPGNTGEGKRRTP